MFLVCLRQQLYKTFAHTIFHILSLDKYKLVEENQSQSAYFGQSGLSHFPEIQDGHRLRFFLASKD